MILALQRPSVRKRRPRKPPRSVRPAGVERRYARALRKLFAQLPPLVRLHLLPQLGSVYRAAGEIAHPLDAADAVRLDGWSSAISSIFSGIRAAWGRIFNGPRVESLAKQAEREAAQHNAELFQRQIKTVLNVDPFRTEPWLGPLMDDATTQAVKLISAVPEKYLADLETMVRDSVRAGRRHEELADLIRERFTGDSSPGAAKLATNANAIARNQTARFTASLARVRQQALGVTRYTWRGVLDQRERDEHVAREGKIFEWTDPPDDGHPGEPPNCRCSAEPVLEDLLED